VERRSNDPGRRDRGPGINVDQVLPDGLYEQLLTARLLRAVEALQLASDGVDPVSMDGLDPSEAPRYLAAHVATVVERVLRAPRISSDALAQVALCNRIVRLLAERDADAADRDTDAIAQAALLLAVQRHVAGLGQRAGLVRPTTPLAQHALFVNAPHEPVLAAELKRELESADRVDLLCAFVVWSGVRVLLDPLRRLRERGVPLRVVTTTYTGATEPRALDALVDLGADVRVSYDARATWLHAKAWLFERRTGFSTAYVGSSNLSHSALHNGLEWNVRLSGVGSPHLLERFRAAFETYWADPHFEPYEPARFKAAIGYQRTTGDLPIGLFDFRPFPHQEEILERLAVERERHGRRRNLIVAATGTGKTMVAAFDYRRLHSERPGARLLFVAHREEILQQSLSTFRAVMRDGSFGELLVAGQRPAAGTHVFASIQSLSRQNLTALDPEFFDVVIVDEFHHAEAATYRRLLEHIRPWVLLGLTATPERADGADVTHWFDGRTATELRLWDALEQGLLCPFQYFGVADDVDLRHVRWQRGGYDLAALSQLYTGNDARVAKVLQALQDIVGDTHRMRALGFCVSVEQARYMARCFNDAGIPARVISGDTPTAEREDGLRALRDGAVNALFSVDVFNEGLDVPQVDTVLFLRPTESATVFLQQLGRGLRRTENKAGLTVLDFVGQPHQNFRFETRFAALTGTEGRRLVRQIEDGFPFLPAGCSIQLDRVAAQVVLENVKGGIAAITDARLAEELRRTGDVSLAEFVRDAHPLDRIYRGRLGWSKLRRMAGFVDDLGPDGETLTRAIGRMRHIDDPERIALYTRVLTEERPPELATLAERERRLLTMLHADLWGTDRTAGTLTASLERFWRHDALRGELRQLLELLDDQSPHLPSRADLGEDVPLWVHARYSRSEVLTAFGVWDIARPPSSREGVLYVKAAGVDVFFVTLQKTPGRFSPTTMYRDYAISRDLFHWESQSTTSAASPTGQRYIHHAERQSRVCLFVRETGEDAQGRTTPFLFLGTAAYREHRGDRPMAITWQLDREIPADFFQVARAAA
jgi:superfamily II DNA or RNA helicase/HKD family nuclease